MSSDCDALTGFAYETDAARLEVVDPADVIEHCAVRARGERIHGEVAPLGVGLPVAAERDLGVAAVGLDILA